MTVWTSLTSTIWSLLDQHGLLMAFVLLLLEESGVPPKTGGQEFLLLLAHSLIVLAVAPEITIPIRDGRAMR